MRHRALPELVKSRASSIWPSDSTGMDSIAPCGNNGHRHQWSLQLQFECGLWCGLQEHLDPDVTMVPLTTQVVQIRWPQWQCDLDSSSCTFSLMQAYCEGIILTTKPQIPRYSILCVWVNNITFIGSKGNYWITILKKEISYLMIIIHLNNILIQ